MLVNAHNHYSVRRHGSSLAASTSFLLGLPTIQPSFLVEQLEHAVLHQAEGVFFVLLHPLEDVALREKLGRADEQALFDEQVTRLFSGDDNEVGHEVGDQQNFCICCPILRGYRPSGWSRHLADGEVGQLRG